MVAMPSLGAIEHCAVLRLRRRTDLEKAQPRDNLDVHVLGRKQQ